MSAYCQFGHMDLYGVTPPKRAKKWSCVDGITREGARAPGACSHVKYPKTPTVIYGVSPVEAGNVAKKRAAVARDSVGRRLRCDGKVLAAIVLSYPAPRQFVEQEAGEKATYADWRKKLLEWLQGLYGKRLLSVVEHADEAFFHVHAYVVPELQPDFRLDWDLFHHGRMARAAAAASGATGKEQNAAYKEGMRGWQDAFHAAVGQAFGHLRLGPRRQRRLRMDHLANKEIAAKKASAEADIARQQCDIVRQREELARDRARIEDEARRAADKRYRGPALAVLDENASLKNDMAALIEKLAAEAKRRELAEAEVEGLGQRLAELDASPRLAV